MGRAVAWAGCAAAAVALLAFAPASAQLASTLPDGWERPSDADLAGPNMRFRKNDPQRYLRAEGDFDGDTVADRAELLVNRIRRTYALFVFASKAAGPIELSDGRIASLHSVGIDTAKPGRTRTACGKGYDARDPKCAKGTPFVDIPFQSIEYFGFESGGSQFYWAGDNFEKVETSD